MLVPHRLCQEMLPEDEEDTDEEHGDVNDAYSSSSSAGHVAKSVVRGVARATLGSMLQFRQIASDVLKGTLIHSDHSYCLQRGGSHDYDVIISGGILNTRREMTEHAQNVPALADHLRYLEGLLSQHGTAKMLALHGSFAPAAEQTLLQYASQRNGAELNIVRRGYDDAATTDPVHRAAQVQLHAYYFIEWKQVAEHRQSSNPLGYIADTFLSWMDKKDKAAAFVE
jgi:hypothetical protein